MKKPAKSNMYEATLARTWERFPSHLDGAYYSIACVVTSKALTYAAKNALESSLSALGYGNDACVFLTMDTAARTAQTQTAESSTTADEGTLKPQDLFAIMEGLDPFVIIITDDAAARSMGEAYRTAIPTLDKVRLLGRDAVTFVDFDAMLADRTEKQKAWGLLKRLPRLES